MDYNEKVNDKKYSNIISDIHKEHQEFFEQKMERLSHKYKLTKEDIGLYFQRVKINDDYVDNFSIEISGSILQQCDNRMFLWRRLKVRSNLTENTELLLKGILFELRLKPFYDEDASNGGIFNGKDWNNFSYCYISPDFENGYWENHSLETKPITN